MADNESHGGGHGGGRGRSGRGRSGRGGGRGRGRRNNGGDRRGGDGGPGPNQFPGMPGSSRQASQNQSGGMSKGQFTPCWYFLRQDVEGCTNEGCTKEGCTFPHVLTEKNFYYWFVLWFGNWLLSWLPLELQKWLDSTELKKTVDRLDAELATERAAREALEARLEALEAQIGDKASTMYVSEYVGSTVNYVEGEVDKHEEQLKQLEAMVAALMSTEAL